MREAPAIVGDNGLYLSMTRGEIVVHEAGAYVHGKLLWTDLL